MKFLALSILSVVLFSISCASLRGKVQPKIDPALKNPNLNLASEITLQYVYSGCSSCPDHRINLTREKADEFSDVSVRYTNLHSNKQRQGRLSAYYYNALLKVLELHRYFDMNDEYAMNTEDGVQVNMNVKIGDKSKSIQTSDAGEVPIELQNIYLVFDGVTSHVVWSDGNPSNTTGMPGY